jgi:hypothetical protein
MTDLSNDKLRALVEASTPGPWIVEADRSHYDTMTIVVAGDERQKPPPVNQMCVSVGGFANVTEAEANTALIAAAPSLAAEVLALRAERDRLREALQTVMPLLASAESNASGNPEHFYVQPRVNLARAALSGEPQP